MIMYKFKNTYYGDFHVYKIQLKSIPLKLNCHRWDIMPFWTIILENILKKHFYKLFYDIFQRIKYTIYHVFYVREAF